MANCLQLALSNPVPGREDEFERWYAAEHLVHGVSTPGVLAGQRFRRADGPWPAGRHAYLTIWEIDDPAFALARLAEARGTGAMPISPAIDMTTVQPPTLWRRATVRSAARIAADSSARGTLVVLLANGAADSGDAFATSLLRGGLAELADADGVVAAELLTLADEQIRGSARKYAYAVLLELHDERAALAALASRLPALPHLDGERWLAPVFRPLGPRLTTADAHAEHGRRERSPSATADASVRRVSGPIPLEVADVTAGWLTSVLQGHAPGASLRAAAVAEAHSGTTGRARMLLTHDDPRLPRSVFVKLAPFDEGQRAFVVQQGMGVAEARFYAEIARDVPVRHPRSWYAAHDESGRYVMVLEDLQLAGARYPGPRDDDFLAFVEHMMDAFAAYHGAFWGSARFAADGDLAWLARRARAYGAAAGFVQFAVEQLGEKLPAASRRFAEAYLPRAERVPALLREGTPTLVHGDAHLGNLFAIGDTPGFLDWAMVSAAPALRDVAYFLGGSVPTELRRAHERRLLARYCARLRAGGVALDDDAAWEQYRVHTLSAWIAAVVTAAMGSQWQPIEIGMAATLRADASIEDHAVADLLRARLP